MKVVSSPLSIRMCLSLCALRVEVWVNICYVLVLVNNPLPSLTTSEMHRRALRIWRIYESRAVSVSHNVISIRCKPTSVMDTGFTGVCTLSRDSARTPHNQTDMWRHTLSHLSTSLPLKGKILLFLTIAQWEIFACVPVRFAQGQQTPSEAECAESAAKGVPSVLARVDRLDRLCQRHPSSCVAIMQLFLDCWSICFRQRFASIQSWTQPMSDCLLISRCRITYFCVRAVVKHTR